MNHARSTLVASLFASLAASVWSAQAPLDADALKEGATNIVSGTVSEVAVLLAYALGRQIEITDRPEIDAILRDLGANDDGFKFLIKRIAISETFARP